MSKETREKSKAQALEGRKVKVGAEVDLSNIPPYVLADYQLDESSALVESIHTGEFRGWTMNFSRD